MLETSDFITHTDVIRNFVQSPERVKLVDYCNAREAKNACVIFRKYLWENDLNYVNIIQRSGDVIFYKTTRNTKQFRGRPKCSF